MGACSWHGGYYGNEGLYCFFFLTLWIFLLCHFSHMKFANEIPFLSPVTPAQDFIFILTTPRTLSIWRSSHKNQTCLIKPQLTFQDSIWIFCCYCLFVFVFLITGQNFDLSSNWSYTLYKGTWSRIWELKRPLYYILELCRETIQLNFGTTTPTRLLCDLGLVTRNLCTSSLESEMKGWC